METRWPSGLPAPTTVTRFVRSPRLGSDTQGPPYRLGFPLGFRDQIALDIHESDSLAHFHPMRGAVGQDNVLVSVDKRTESNV